MKNYCNLKEERHEIVNLPYPIVDIAYVIENYISGIRKLLNVKIGTTSAHNVFIHSSNRV